MTMTAQGLPAMPKKRARNGSTGHAEHEREDGNIDATEGHDGEYTRSTRDERSDKKTDHRYTHLTDL